ncbi:MAG: tetratricopeptide repeat protein [Candidatus Heimdallarchaeota archaeon]
MTEISCKICDEKINFSLTNPNTYIHKSESGNSMIGKLFTIRVSHSTASDSLHINVVVIDEQGNYRAHKDFYEEKRSQKGATSLWSKLIRYFPSELQGYLSLATREEKDILIQIPDPKTKKPSEWYSCLSKLMSTNNSQLLTLLAVKWGFIIGKGKDLIDYDYKQNSWSYPIYLRLLARFKSSSDLIEQAKQLDFYSKPLILQLESTLAKAEVYLRLSAYDLLENLYNNSQIKWGTHSSLDVKSALMFLQAYYGFSFYFLGKINEAIKLIKPVFNFGQVLENREIISVVGNFYAAVLQSSGDLEKALEVFELVLEVSEEIGDERTNAVISTNMSVIESRQGLHDQALKRQQTILTLPVVQAEFFLKISIMSIYAETLFIAEKYDASRRVCQSLLLEEKIPTYYKIDVLSTLKRIAGKTSSNKLLEYVRSHLPNDSEFMESPVGHIFIHDLRAIEAELHNEWDKMISNLKKEREIMIENQSVEDASDIEIRLAEAYFKYFQDSEKLEYLNHAYNHLDLAKTIAIENQNYLDLCRLVMLKGLLAVESKLPNQARNYFEEALQTAKNYNLTNIQKELLENIEQLNKGLIDNSADSGLRRMFKRLTFRKTEEKKTTKKSEIYAIYVGTQDSAWELILQNEKSGSNNDVNYLLGFHDLWISLKNSLIQQQVNYFTVRRGAVLIENSTHFQLCAFGDHLDYITRITIQNLLPDLEKFSFRHIPEELDEKVLETLNKNIGKFSKIEILK